MRTIAIICARRGSKGLPNKNLLSLAGMPLIAHTIRHAIDSGVCDAVLVSTEDDDIANVAKQYGAEVVARPADLATDFVPAEPVIQHALKTYEADRGTRFDCVVYLQTTDLFRTPDMIRKCVELMIVDPSLDSAFSAYETHKNFWRKTADGFERVWKKELDYGPRQKAEQLYREDTGIACATRAELVRQGKRIGPRVAIIPTEDFRTSIDIHTPFDFWLAEKVLTEWEGKND